MIRYFVRTTNERKLDKSYDQVDYEKLVDLEHKPVESFIKQLEFINDFDCVLLEDDLILCKDFKKLIESVIRQYPNRIINFFTYPLAYFNTEESRTFMYNQCTYYPKGITKMIANEMKKINNCKQYDVMENIALNHLNIKHIRYRPCLVQHLDLNTLIQKKSLGRRTPYFIDYLEELNIPYEEASKPENKEKLIQLMNDKFALLDNKKDPN